MIIADHLWPTGARRAVGIDQRLCINLEAFAGILRHVPGGSGLLDEPLRAEQEAAAFLWEYTFGMGGDRCERRAGNRDGRAYRFQATTSGWVKAAARPGQVLNFGGLLAQRASS